MREWGPGEQCFPSMGEGGSEHGTYPGQVGGVMAVSRFSRGSVMKEGKCTGCSKESSYSSASEH